MSSSFWQMSPMSTRRKDNDVLRYRVCYSRGRLVGQVRGEEGPMWASDRVKSASPSYLYENRGPYRLTAYTWHFPYDAAIWQAQTLALLPLNFFFFPASATLTHCWLCSEQDGGFCASVVSPSVWKHHHDIFWGLSKTRSESWAASGNSAELSLRESFLPKRML